MKCFIALVVFAALSEALYYKSVLMDYEMIPEVWGTPEDFNIFQLNRAVAECGPSNILNQGCDCDVNDVFWTECIAKKVNLPFGPKIGTCVSMKGVDAICSRYSDPNEVRTCPPETTECPDMTTECPEMTTECPENTTECPESTTPPCAECSENK